MESDSGTQVPHFNFRDFLLYVVPGGVGLASILLLNGVTREDLKAAGGIAESLLAVLAAYLLGHLAYGLTYPVRLVLPGWEEETEDWLTDHMWVIEKHPAYYFGEVFRYRNLCRMFLALVLPVLMAGVSAAYRAWSASAVLGVAFVVMGMGGAVSCSYRAVRYNKRYLYQISLCRKFRWTDEDEPPVGTGKSERSVPGVNAT